ncbi:T9SS type B sorting domain-containing protein [Muricauda sp. 334s03]|uniref:T9SS type B sorting domain-containing protein n=1 Tax=Flagellimonas yonaguniensis TaxID=3031325 RepID=A0ABT5XUP5_9FLAO|nr:T9SS type B sorting domain-containing protein [[Muricauda] yonaguniensis]MDF0714816.1 T9SS type B sorting domain-containing protein [[Muricauda] yonaguniensis]
MKTSLLRWGTTICILLFSYTGIAQVKNNFDVRYENELRGDLTFIANNIVNRDEGGDNPEDPYNLTGSSSEYNDRLNMQYIDIDGDPSTFSSSSATLAVPDSNCSLVRYAGLYWSAVYRDNNRSSDFDEIKFRVPGGSYVDLTADEILFDGDGDADFGNYAPYACYKDVTSIITGLANPDGDYFVANVRASSGDNVQGGVSGGWSLVVVYENPTLPGKYITTFDGYAGIKSGETVDIPFSGFTTLPAPFPVNAKLGVAALEGDNRISGDRLSIRADSNGSFTTLSNSANPSNNFFNSNITDEGVIQTNRNPNSVNTLGWDVDLFTIPNPSNSVIPNSETGATLRASSSQDKYDIFFTSLDVEIIEPIMNLVKTVEDIGGNDITGQGVNLGQYLDYVLTFQNVGNDDAINYTIRDVLPINVTLDESSISMPAGVSYTYDPVTRTVLFTVPDNIIEEGDPARTIRMRVQVAENCFDFVDACTDIIQNLAYSTYQGAINSAQITDDPSVSEFNGCGFGTPGATNFLLDDLSACNFTRTVQLCGDDVLLDAGDNFDNYIWYRDENGNNTIDVGTDTVITDGDSDNDPSTMVVTEIGTYIVDKQVADPCKDFQEIITVELFGSVQSNPITALINDTSNTIDGAIDFCPNDGSELPEIFLCGLNDTELIQINIPDATSIEWEQLDENSCTESDEGCANTNASCTWNTVDTGNDFLAENTGQYRLVINYQNGCFSRFYFNIYKNPLDPQYTSSDIICDTPGNITVTNMPLTYEFQLVDQATGNILVPYGPSPSFNITNNGAYMVEMRQQGVTDGCVFVLDNIGILERDFQVDVVPQDTDCNGLGEIAISVLNVEAQYYYEISQGGTVVDTHGPSNDNNYTFENLNDGIYDVTVTTDDGCDHTEQVTINDVTDLAVSAITTKNIDCTDGIISVTGSGGFPNPDYYYAIWSYNGTNLYTDISDIPATAYQTTSDFTFANGEEGTYQFVVVDGNNCHAFSNSVIISISPSVEYTTLVVDEACFGAEDGSFSVNVTNSNGYILSYTLTYPDSSTTSNTSGTFSNLPQGDFSLTITQTQGSISCDFVETFTIDGPDSGVTADAVLIQDYTCLQDGIIDAQNVTGGTAPYEYSIDGVTFNSTSTFTNLTDGTYTITVRDDNGCTFTDSVTIDSLDPPTDIDFSATDPLCPTFLSDITLSVTGGEPALVYEIISPAGSAINNGNNNTFADLAPGTYMFRVTDGNDCFYEESYTIAPVTEISVTGQLVSNITCFGDSDGEIQYTVNNFNTDYNYTVTGPDNFSGTNETNSTISLTGLAEGTYTITVTDNLTNCTDTTDVTINAPPSALDAIPTVVQPTCLADGSVNIVATGGWGSYTYEITSGPASYTLPAPQNNGLFSGLDIDGLYEFTVTDANGCEFTDTFTINEAVAPELEIVPNDICYDDAVGLTLTANVIAGGDGNYEYSLNGGPFVTNNVFSGLTPGDYTIEVRDGNGCTDSESLTIDPELSVVASAPNITACGTNTDITITAAGGDGNYVYAVVADGATPADTDFAPTNPVTGVVAGNYDVYVRDNGGAAGYCEASYDITIVQDDPLAISVTNTDILCSGESQAQITITANGGEAPYTYSIDNGATYQTSNTFYNQPAGSYNIRVRDANNCEVTEIYSITEPITLSASAAVTALVECNPSSGAEVRITNAIGGTAPYEYSFDGGSTYGGSSIGYLLPGTHTLYIRDANLCTYPMSVTIDPEPTPPNATASVDYECDGEGTITVTPDSPDFDYTYEIDGAPNTPNDSNVFNDVPVGNHTITVNYVSNSAPSPSILLSENFGTGPNTSISEIDPVYCYEPQDGSASLCGFGTDTHIQDGEYSVTQNITNPYGTWQSPDDHSGLSNGRFLAINVGGVAGVGGIVYQKTGVEVIPNRDITVSLWAFNLLRNGESGGDPSIEIQLVDAGGTVIQSTTTGSIPKNTSATDWHDYNVTLNPGANSNLDIVIRTNSSVTDGNDIAIDDIEAYQIPEVCGGFITLDVNVEDGHAFDGAITAYTDLTCNSADDGSITFEVENFDPGTGFTYQVDSDPVSGIQTASPITVSGLSAGNHTITLIDLRDPACSVVLNQTLTQPDVVDVTASVTTELTCTNGGATVTATATGGTPVYQYQLEDTSATPTIIAAFQSSNVFSGLPVGDYVIRTRDINLCEDTTTITVDPYEIIAFDLTPTVCYSGNNDGNIRVDVTSGNGNYQFSINGGAWMTPTPSDGTTYMFNNLVAGTYTVDVRDQYGCSVQDTATINPALTASAFLDSDLTCLADATITITANGGTAPYSYQWSNDGGTTYNSTGFTGNVFNTDTAGTYMFQVTDAAGCTTTTNSIIVTPADQPVISNVIPTDILCSGESTGTLDVVIDTSVGVPPYTINVVETSGPINYGSQTTGLPAGSYEVTITDDKGCVSDPFPVIISEPTPIVPNVTHTNLTCVASSTELGTITVDASGGTPDYIYQVYNNDFSVNLTYDTSTGTNDHTFTGLDFGDYTIQITDANGCQNISTVTITTGPDILITTVGASGCTPGSGEMTVEAQASNGTLGIGTFYFAIYPAPAFNAADPAWFPEDPLPAADNTHLFTGLTPGVTYTFIVFDTDTNCEYIQEATVPVATNSTLISTIDASTNITCTGAADGTVGFTISGYGGNNVNYEIFYTNTHTTTGITGTISGAVGGPESDTASGLSPGEYYILYEEADGPNAGCVIASDEFLIEQAPTLLQVTANSPINDNCNPNAGVINASAQYGMAPYEYLYLLASDPAPTASTGSWTSNTTANVDAGNYIVYAKDANDCIQSDPVTVLEDPSPEISISIVDECVDEGLFEVMVTLDNPADAMAPFQISVNGAAFQNFTFDGSNQYLISGLSSGLGHTIEVRDLNGCIDIETFDIHPPLEFIVTQTVDLDCELGAAGNAELLIEVISGSGNYEYTIDGPGITYDVSRSVLTSNPFTWTGAGVAGSYDVVVFDMGTAPPNCPKTITVDVPEATQPSFTTTYTDVTCNGDDDGTITVTAVDNGIGPYTFEIIGASDGSISVPIAPTSTTPTTATFTGLAGSAAGITYDIEVVAANNCDDIESVTITEPDPIDNIDVDVVEFACSVGNNPNNASITVDTSSITGGSGNYVTYEFINDAGSVVVQSGSNPTYIETDINGGNYTINVYDDNGCLGTTTAVIAPYDQITNAVAAVTNPLSCSPGLDGEITITVTSTLGDPSRFEYSIDNGSNWQNSNVFGNLDVGTHNFLVRHLDTGCVVSTSETITNPNTFNIDVNVVSNVICYGTATGEVTFELLDATYIGGFNWTIYDTNGTPTNTADDIPVTNGTSATTGPTAPISLPAGSYTVEISQDAFPECTNVEAFNIAGPNATITGSAIVTDITCVDDGTIEVIASGGWGGYTYYVGVGAPGTYVSNPIFSGLTADTYEVWVRDSSGCEEHIDTITLDDPDPISALLQINQSNCVDLQGEIEVVGTIGGQGSNYMYQLIKDGTNFGSPQTNTIFSGLGAGSYTVEITDQWGCSITLPATLELYNAMTANATVDKTIDCTMNPGGQITINVTGGSSNLQYSVEDPLGNVTIDADADGVFTGLTEPGEYIFTITDLDTSEPCTYEVRQTLDDKVDPILLDATIVDVSCAGGSDGSILANLDPATALNPPYQYELIGLAGAPSRPLQDEPFFENLPQGTYQVRVVSERECEDIKTETVDEPNPLGATATATAFECTPSNSVDESTITVTPSGGTPFAGPDPYLYSFEGNSFTSDNTFDVVDDGTVQTINYIVRDANGCEYWDSVDVQPLNTFTLDANQDFAISCINPESVILTVTESTPGDTYTFELLPTGNPYGNVVLSSVTPISATFELTEPGSYTFRATNDVTGCYVEEIYTIDPFDTIDVDATATAPAMCFDDAGELTIDVSGYTGDYDYYVYRTDGTLIVSGSENTSSGSLAITHPDLRGGNYYVEVEATEAPFCTATSGTVTIISPSAELDYTPQEVANVTCTNDQGEILINPTGGYAPYDIVLTNTTTSQVYTMDDVQSYVFTGLSAGVYTVRVTDDGGCFEDRGLTLEVPDPITADIDAAPIDLLCYGDDSASVWADNVAGGSGSYAYQLNIYEDDSPGADITFTSGAQSSNIFNNLGAGTYSITVTDGWNCSDTTDTVTITEPTEVRASLIQLSEMTCNDDAQLELTATGGTAPYFYSTDDINFFAMDGGDTHTFDVGADEYQYYVRDFNGCDAILSNQVTVDEVPELMLEIDESAAIINCMGEASATIIAQATGGLGNYSYELFSDAALTNLVDGPQTNGTFSGLPAGEYYVRVTSEDCVEVSPVITIIDPEPLVVDREEFTDITCSGMNDGTITVEVSGGTGEILYAISPNLDQFDTTNTFTDLEPGIYDVIAQDVNGCFITFQFEITQPEPIVAEAVNIMDEVCFESGDGSFELQITGGTAPYETSLNSSADGNFVQDQFLFQDLTTGTHVVFIRDAQGCETNVVVEIEPGVNLGATVTPVYECTGSVPDNYLEIVLEDESIAGNLMYALDSTDPADMLLSADFTNMVPGDHYLTIAHANGCMTTYDFTIEAYEPLTLVLENNIYNQITAIAAGGVEDYTFYFNDIDNGTDNIYYISETGTYTVTVIDQNGCEATAEIFMEFMDIDFPNFFTPDGDGRNDIWIPDNIEGFPDVLIKIYDRYGRVVEEMARNVQGWDGNYDGKPLPTGDYWYVVRLEGEQDNREFVGHFTLYRK